MELKRIILGAANALVSFIIVISLVIAGSYSLYALWDNNRVYSAAGDVQADMIKLKPKVVAEAEEEGADFSELLEINEDVCAWVTMDNTDIDHPILQGETNLTYINKDVYGNFALAGSIYLDSRNNRDFTDMYSLLYGHYMEQSKMFGDLELYKKKKFFKNNRTGMLILPDRSYKLETFSCLLVEASDDYIFDPTQWRDGNRMELLSYVKEHSVHMDEEIIQELENSEEPIHILSLSTCSTEFTNARTIVLTVMRPFEAAESGGEIE